MTVLVVLAEKWLSSGRKRHLVEAYAQEDEGVRRFDELIEKGWSKVVRVPVNVL